MKGEVIRTIGIVAAGVAVGAYLIERVGFHPDIVFYPAAVMGIACLAVSLYIDNHQTAQPDADPVGDGDGR